MNHSLQLVCLIGCLSLVLIPGASALGGEEGWITVYCNVDGASVYFDGTYKGTINGGSFTAAVYTTATPFRTATVEKSGYTTYSSPITMPSAGETTTIYATINPLVTPTPDQYGSLFISSQPSGAEIYVNGDYRGLSPLTVNNLWPGSYTVRAEKTGYQDYSTSAYVAATVQTTVHCSLTPQSAPGSLYVISTPAGSNVYLDSAYKGITPITISNIAPGNHALEVDHAGYYDWKSTVNVPAGGTRTIQATLNPMPSSTTGWVYVSSSPGGATVTLDGTIMGETPSSGSLKLNNVGVGSHAVVLTRPGYQQYTATASVSANTVTEVSAILQPTTAPSGSGSLTVSSTPAGANVFIDNAFVGISPVTVPNVAAGTHTVSMKLDGYQEYAVSTQVNSGAVSTVSAALSPITPTPRAASVPAALAIIGIGIAALVLFSKRT